VPDFQPVSPVPVSAPPPRVGDGSFVFLSQLLGAPVVAPGGHRLGRLADLLCEVNDIGYPRIRALRVKTSAGLRRVEWDDVERCEPGLVELKREGALLPLVLPPLEIPLAQEVLDKQVLDTDDAKVERVNDLHLLRARGELRVAHVDVGFRGLVRRMGWERAVDGLTRLFRPGSLYLSREQFVPWKHVRPLSSGVSRLKLDVTRTAMSELHPSDLAEILGELDRTERAVLFRELPVDAAADALEVTEPGLQRELLKMVEPGKAADLLEAMEPDAAADLLESLPPLESERLLEAMEPQEKREVEELLTWPENAAGGLMTPDFIRLRPSMNAGEALAAVREQAAEVAHLHDAYVLSSEGKLVGVVSLRALLRAAPDEPLAGLLDDQPSQVTPDAPFAEVAQIAERYKLLSLPVLAQGGRLLGVITVDDILTKVLRG
jgi:magnesium transporter